MKQDLKTRIPVAILYVLFIAIMCLSGKITAAIMLGIFGLLCLHEFITKSNNRADVTMRISMITLISVIVISINPLNHIVAIAAIISVLFLMNIVSLVVNGRNLLNHSNKHLVACLYIILPFIFAIYLSLNMNVYPLLLLGTFIILWLNDAGAYFIGSSIGKRKLFPSISPNKTWEGFLGGGIVGVLICFAIVPVFQIYDLKTWIILSLIIWIFGAYGDLIESSWKRHNGIKDSGTLMRGHGGFLDRLDSFIYAIPFVSLYFLLFLNQ